MEGTGLIRVICGVIFVLALLLASLALWVFPTLARFELTNKQILHNAMIHMLACFPKTLVALFAAVGGFALAAWLPQALPLITLFIPAFVVWYMSRTAVKRFRKFDGSKEETEEAVSQSFDGNAGNPSIELN